MCIGAWIQGYRMDVDAIIKCEGKKEKRGGITV
jgi:hypothetical protein